jgi:hypothetical protein
VSTNPRPRPVEELELQAERERQRINQRVAEIRCNLEERLDVRRIAEDRIRSRPAPFYSAVAALAALTGYVLARLIKA